MFKKITDTLSEGNCPYCDNISFKFMENDVWMFLCHDCQRYFPFAKLNIKDSEEVNHIKFNNLLALCTKVSDLPMEHAAVLYCQSRKLPIDRLYYTDKFDTISEYAGTPIKDKQRLILPFFSEDGELFGIQGRTLADHAVRYITLMFDKTATKIFGLDQVDTEKDFVIVEGPIDSLFVNNCLAFAGAEKLDNKYLTNATVCYDNEPRNQHIVNKTRQSLTDGFKTVIWPSHISAKDINDMVLSGLDVNTIIKENTYRGMSGMIKLNEWKKV